MLVMINDAGWLSRVTRTLDSISVQGVKETVLHLQCLPKELAIEIKEDFT
jgi:hypothetical protein